MSMGCADYGCILEGSHRFLLSLRSNFILVLVTLNFIAAMKTGHLQSLDRVLRNEHNTLQIHSFGLRGCFYKDSSIKKTAPAM